MYLVWADVQHPMADCGLSCSFTRSLLGPPFPPFILPPHVNTNCNSHLLVQDVDKHTWHQRQRCQRHSWCQRPCVLILLLLHLRWLPNLQVSTTHHCRGALTHHSGLPSSLSPQCYPSKGLSAPFNSTLAHSSHGDWISQTVERGSTPIRNRKYSFFKTCFTLLFSPIV